MHGEEIDAELGGVGDGALDGVADVEQLHVEKDVLAWSLQHAGELEAAGEQQFETDLVEADRVAELGDEALRLFDRRHVEGDDQTVFGGRRLSC